MTSQPLRASHIAVVIPCYRVQGKVVDVIARIGPEVSAVYVVDDGCPEKTADLVEREVRDPRVHVIRHGENRGVGAATLTGMQAAADAGATILVKLDGDGQMDPGLIPKLVMPIIRGRADYTKGNRFFAPEMLHRMPAVRMIGNGMLSFLMKISSGYWTIFDPTNGFIALHVAVFRLLPLSKIAPGFFFESDLLFRLSTIRALPVDVPLQAIYDDERSNLRIRQVILPFIWYLTRNFTKRIGYTYFLRDFSIGSIYLLSGFPIFLFGVIFGSVEWIAHVRAGVAATAGTVMVGALPVIVGFQLLLAFLAYDVAMVPRTALHPFLAEADEVPEREKD
jgi:glycosyltransferase involved in cell wall biosynthesis